MTFNRLLFAIFAYACGVLRGQLFRNVIVFPMRSRSVFVGWSFRYVQISILQWQNATPFSS